MGRLRVILMALMWVALSMSCGDDGDGGSPDRSDDEPIDAAVVDAAAASVDAAAGGTQQLGQFCDILETGGPYCATGLECCASENVCREPSDCQGNGSFLSCTQGSDCPNNLVCCEIPSMTFCTKHSACAGYSGTELP